MQLAKQVRGMPIQLKSHLLLLLSEFTRLGTYW